MPLITSGSRIIRRRAASGNGLLTNLIAYWGLDEAGGANNALDKHSNGLTLTQNGSLGSAAGLVYAGARTFAAASTQYFSRTSESLLQTGDIDFVVSAWVYPTGTAIEMLYARDDSAANREFYLARTTTNTQFAVWDASSNLAGVVNGSAMSLNQWSLVVAWHDATNNIVGVSINNGTATTNATTGSPTAKTIESTIGKRMGSTPNYFSGRMGPVMFWKNRVLDATARTTLYNAGAGLTYAAFTA